MQRLKTLCREIWLIGMKAIPVTTGHAVWVSKYQRRTLTGIGWKTKTVRRRTGKTPRTIVITFCATTSASIMVRFFCILDGYAFKSISFVTAKKNTFLVSMGILGVKF